MFYDFFTQHKTKILVGVVLFIIALISWLVYYFVFSFHITSITPNPSAASYLQPKLEISFNRDLVTEGLKVESDDLELSYRISDKNKLEISISSKRQIGKKYKLTIVQVASSKGDIMKNHSIALSALSSEASLSEADRTIILDKQQDNKPNIFNDPISALVPYDTLQYAIRSEGIKDESGKIIVTVSIYLSNADVKIDRQGAIDRAKQAALDYLRTGSTYESSVSSAVNPDDYTIQYKIMES